MVHFTVTSSVQINGDVHIDLASIIKCESNGYIVVLFKRFREAHEHNVIATPLQVKFIAR